MRGEEYLSAAEKWITLPSLLEHVDLLDGLDGLNVQLLERAVCSFLSSVPLLLCTFLTFLLGVPLPLYMLH